MSLKVLIIDDNENYAQALAINLRNTILDFDPHIELTCKDGYDYFLENQHEIGAILLDVNFDEQGEGLELLKEIKDISNVWIGLISQTFETESAPEQLGCDAFYSKENTEGLAAALVAIRRGQIIPRSNNACKLEFKNDQFFCNNILIPLKGKQFALLKYLYGKTEGKNTAKSKYKISEKTKIAEESVRTQVSNIRAKFPSHCRKIIIVSVEGFGYYCPFPEKNKV